MQLDNYLSSASTSVERLALYPHATNAFIKANSMLQFGSSVTSVQRSWTDPDSRRCKLSDKHVDMFAFLKDCLIHVNCELCTAAILKNNLTFMFLKACLPKQTLNFTNALKCLD